MLILAMLVQAASAPQAAPPTLPPLHGGPSEMTCPVGGERFSTWQASHYSTMGSRPDGRPYSYLPFPLPIPECPTNKLIVFDDFNADEITRLQDMLSSPQYRALVDRDTSYYRGYWLAAALRRDDDLVLGLLLRAIWQATPESMGVLDSVSDHERSLRYQSEFVKQVDARVRSMTADDRLAFEARAANAHRQLGNFDAAAQMRERALVTMQGASVETRKGWHDYLIALGTVIARRDQSVEPLDMIPDTRVVFACAERTPLNSFDAEICGTPEMESKVEAFRARTRLRD